MPNVIDIELFKADQQALDDFLQSWIGHKMNMGGTQIAPDPVNMPMIASVSRVSLPPILNWSSTVRCVKAIYCTQISFWNPFHRAKKTGLGQGYFVTWITEFMDQDNQAVGRQSFRVLKFDPSTIGQ